MLFKLEDLKELNPKPRVHGNGFIQLDLPSEKRLHIWPDQKFDTQAVSTQIHDHRFNLVSTVICGKLVHIEYAAEYIEDPMRFQELLAISGTDVEDIPDMYDLYEPVVRDRQDTVLMPAIRNVKLIPQATLFLSQGSTYTFNHARFHETYGVGLTATIMTKTAVYPHYTPKVACRVDQVPDNDFNRYQFAPDVIWNIVDQVVKKLGGVNLEY